MKYSRKIEKPVEILGYSKDVLKTGKMRVFSVTFRAITKAERETIKKIINISHFPIMVIHSGDGSKKHLSFLTNRRYTSFKKMYEENGIDKDLIQDLKFKRVILKIKRNQFSRIGGGIFIYFNPDCNFLVDFCTRKVLMEKYIEKYKYKIRKTTDNGE